MAGIVYLLHFDRPYKHAQHYIGYSSNHVQRLAHHAQGTGSRLLQVVRMAGITWVVAALWQGDRRAERRLKRWGSAKRQCPICQARPCRVKFMAQLEQHHGERTNGQASGPSTRGVRG